MERETGFEPATSTLARWRSTTELFPLYSVISINEMVQLDLKKVKSHVGPILLKPDPECSSIHPTFQIALLDSLKS